MTVLSRAAIQARCSEHGGMIYPCEPRTEAHGLSHGLGPAGYDVRLVLGEGRRVAHLMPGAFLLAATAERFDMPTDVVAIVHDKSSLARKGLSVFNTVIEPGWRGFLTLELVNHGKDIITLVEGQGIAQVIFHLLDTPTEGYDGKYQDQEYGPQVAR